MIILLVTQDKKPYGKTKVSKKIAIAITLLLSAAIVIQLINQQINFEPEELDEKIGSLLFSITISIFGIVFAIMAHNDMNKYLVRAFGLLFVGILPIISAIPLMLEPVSKLAIFFPVYLTVTFGWFFGICHLIIGKGDDEEKAYARKTIKIMLGYLLYIAIGTFALYLLALSFPHSLPSEIDA